ncbi:MAG: prepilin peptidase [bacterium]|nr:prepilin peptidase [bacterium]
MAMLIPITIIFIFGLTIGSFINVVAFRYPDDSTIGRTWLKILGGRSRCPNCNKTLRWYELVPLISFLIQLGKCRGCGVSISWRYPIVELFSGLAAALWYATIFTTLPWWQAVTLAVAIFILILAAAIDARLSILPDGLNLSLAILGLALVIMRADYINSLVAAAGGILFFGGIVLLSQGRAMGMGDIKLAGAMGLLLGWPGAVLAFMLSFITGAIWGILLIMIKRKKLRDAIPFGPFLVAGSLLVVFFGPQISAIIRL